MRNPIVSFDDGDRRAMRWGAAAGLGVMTLLALRADWLLAAGVLAFRRTGQNVAAYVMGLDLLPWTLLVTAALAAGTVVVLGRSGGATSVSGAVHHSHWPRDPECRRGAKRRVDPCSPGTERGAAPIAALRSR